MISRLALSMLLLSMPLFADEDPNDAFHNEAVTASLGGNRTITAILTHKPGVAKFKHALALFPGSPGHGNFRIENGKVAMDDLRGNFLVRARRHFAGDDMLAVLIDAPSDYQSTFPQAYRETERYGNDVRAIIDAVEKRYGRLEWTLIGTSEGSVSAAHAGRMLTGRVKRVVLTSSLVEFNRQGRGLDVSDVKKIAVPVLWVHHKNDPCKATPYVKVKAYAESTGAPLVTVTGSAGGRGDPCEARTEHGFVGVEIPTIRAIRAWILDGRAPPDVAG